MPTDLVWLPERAEFADLLERAQHLDPDAAFDTFRTLANSRMDFVRAAKLDKAIER